MNANESNGWYVGQKVVYVAGHYGRTPILAPAVVLSVWKNGVAKIAVGGKEWAKTFDVSGYERSKEYNSGHIRSLKDGETHESIEAARQDANTKAKIEAKAKADEKAKAVAEWWETEGQAMWEARINLPNEFMGKAVAIIRYTRHGEEYMPFVVIEKEKDMWSEAKGEEKFVWKLTSGGLVGRQYNVGEKGTPAYKEVTNVNTFSNSTIEGDSLEEALYKIVR